MTPASLSLMVVLIAGLVVAWDYRRFCRKDAAIRKAEDERLHDEEMKAQLTAEDQGWLDSQLRLAGIIAPVEPDLAGAAALGEQLANLRELRQRNRDELARLKLELQEIRAHAGQDPDDEVTVLRTLQGPVFIQTKRPRLGKHEPLQDLRTS